MAISKANLPSSDLLTAEEVAAQLRLPLSTVYYLAKKGEIPAVRFGRSWRFSAQGLERLAQNNARPRILIVDDDAVTRTLVTETLTPCGCLVTEADSIKAALEAVRRQQFDGLLIDLKLPDGDGTALVRELRRDYPLSRMVIITAFPEVAQANALFEMGAVTLLRKPLSGDQLIECVEGYSGMHISMQTRRTQETGQRV